MPEQTLFAGVVVAAAVGYIAWRAWTALRGQPTQDCPSCGSCNAKPGRGPKIDVPIETLTAGRSAR